MRRSLRKILLLALAALLMGSGALAVSDYGDDAFELLGTETLTLQGEYGEHTLEVVKQKYLGDGETDGLGVLYRNGEEYYGLYDPGRDIGVYIAVSDKNEVKTGERTVHWPAEMPLGPSDEVEALYQVVRIYDYYRNLGWVSVTGDGSCPIKVYTNVHYVIRADSDHDFTDNAGAMYYEDRHVTEIYIGEGSQTLDFDVLAHEYTHAVLHAHGVRGTGKQTLAVHEGFADVMGVCAAGADWDMFSWRSLSGGTPECAYHITDYHKDMYSHHAGTIIGHAAYLMAEELEGQALTKLQIAKVFLKSMDDLGNDPTFWDAGHAILRAAEALHKEKDASKDFILSTAQVNRVRAALEEVGLLLEGEATPEPTQAPADADAVLKKGLKKLKKKYGTPKTGKFKGSKVRSAQELEGIIAAARKDFDGDGTSELLVWRLESWSTDALVLNLEMYEETDGQCALAASRALRLPWLVNPNGRMGSSATGFIYKKSGKWIAGVDTYFGFNEDTVTASVYAYSEKKGLYYLGGACHAAYGEGTIEVRQAEKEPGELYALFGASWFSLKDGKKTPWKTVKHYDVEEHDWKAPGEERRKKLYKAYREILEDRGLSSAGDRRILPPAMPEDYSEYGNWWEKNILQEPADIYGETKGFEAQWRIVSWQRDGKSRMLVEGD